MPVIRALAADRWHPKTVRGYIERDAEMCNIVWGHCNVLKSMFLCKCVWRYCRVFLVTSVCICVCVYTYDFLFVYARVCAFECLNVKICFCLTKSLLKKVKVGMRETALLSEQITP